MLDAAIVRGVEAVVHARCEPQRDVTAIAIGLGQRVVAQQLRQFIMRALDLIERRFRELRRGRRRLRRTG